MSQSDELLASLVETLGDQIAIVSSGQELQKAIGDRVVDMERAVGLIQAEQIRAAQRFVSLSVCLVVIAVAALALAVVAVLT